MVLEAGTAIALQWREHFYAEDSKRQNIGQHASVCTGWLPVRHETVRSVPNRSVSDAAPATQKHLHARRRRSAVVLRRRPVRTLRRRPGQGSGNLVRPGRSAGIGRRGPPLAQRDRSEEHTSELQSLMRISYAVFCLKKKQTIYIEHSIYARTRNKK